MNTRPRISVLLPAYNAAKSLPMALGSLVAQSWSDWECIFVDDGSSDDTWTVSEKFVDGRLRRFRLDKNSGRPTARNLALREARGQYLCMLDADDWYYPQKLAEQLEVMEGNTDLALVSTAMAIVDDRCSLLGVRAKLNVGVDDLSVAGPSGRLTMPAMAFAPSMIRATAIGAARYDVRFQYAEDVDFLLQVVRGQRFGVINRPRYVYDEVITVRPRKVLGGLQSVVRMFWKYRRDDPVGAGREMARAALKWVAYAALFTAGGKDWALKRRRSLPSSQEAEEFRIARSQVSGQVDALFSISTRS